MVTVSRLSSPLGVFVLATIEYDGGHLRARKHPKTGAVSVTFTNRWGEVSMPMLTRDNQAAWQAVVEAVLTTA